MDKISVIIPCHNNAGALRRVYTDVLREVKKRRSAMSFFLLTMRPETEAPLFCACCHSRIMHAITYH